MSILDEEQSAYVIRGGLPIHGTLVPGGNKNAALPMLAATLLAEGTVELANVPQIRDAAVMLELLSSRLGRIASLHWSLVRFPDDWLAKSGPRSCPPAHFWLDSGAPRTRARGVIASGAGPSMPTSTRFRRSVPKWMSDRSFTVSVPPTGSPVRTYFYTK